MVLISSSITEMSRRSAAAPPGERAATGVVGPVGPAEVAPAPAEKALAPAGEMLVTSGPALASLASASAGEIDDSRMEEKPATANPADTAPRRAAWTGSRPSARPAATPPQNASPAPVVSMTGPGLA